jgi:S-adenosylmethionine-diacylglycerol 3-amino-3-carboxypropyl transferase
MRWREGRFAEGELHIMAFETALRAPGGGDLLKRAVHRNRTLSLEGLLERAFTLVFRGLVYPQIWEDPEVDLAAMNLDRHHHVVAIASGGCNVLSYLAAGPGRITAVDLNRAHVALTRLKLAGLSHLPDWQTYYRFFGEANERRNLHDYERYLRPVLDHETRRYWEGRGPDGRRRLGHFRSNLYRRGLLGRCIGLGHLVARLHGANPAALLDCRSLEEQARVFKAEIAPLFRKRLIRWATGHRISLYGLGIPPAQYEALAGGASMAEVLLGRLERLACAFPVRDNYFAWQAFGRCYAPGAAGPMPPYLEERNFAALRANAGRVTVTQASLTDALLGMPPASVDRFVLLDAQDWMTDRQLNDLWRAIARAAAPKARVLFRTAGSSTILPGRVEDSVLGEWRYLEERSAELGSRDRSSIYGGFHIYER